LLISSLRRRVIVDVFHAHLGNLRNLSKLRLYMTPYELSRERSVRVTVCYCGQMIPPGPCS